MPRATIREIARKARVGTATVDRVLNGRGGVRHEISERVLKAAKALHYGKRQLDLYRGTIRIEIILARPESRLFIRLSHAFERIAATLDRSIFIHRTFVNQGDPASIADYIERPSFRRDGLIVAVPDHSLIVESLRKVQATGVEVAQIVHVITGGTDAGFSYVGIDDYAAGRTAELLMSRMLGTRPGALIALCSRAYSGQRERLRGFSDYLAERRNPAHRFPAVMFTSDDDVATMEVVQETITREGDVIGLCSVGAGNRAIASVLRRRGSKVFWIGFEFDELAADCLRSGVMDIVIDQAPEVQARRSLDMIMRRLGLMEVEISADPVQFHTITSENL